VSDYDDNTERYALLCVVLVVALPLLISFVALAINAIIQNL
jgi:hypothetical protein